MKTNQNTNRRSFINKLLKGVALGTAASLLVPNKLMANTKENSVANVYAMWTHGSEGKMEGVFHDGKDTVSFGDKLSIDIPNFLHPKKRNISYDETKEG